MWRARLVIALLFVAAPPWAAAQQSPATVPSPGNRVRVDADSGFSASIRRLRLTGSTGRPGTLLSFNRDSLVFRPDRSDSALTIALSDIRGLYVSRGRSSRVRDGAIGLVGGAVGGLVTAAIMDRSGGKLEPYHYATIAGVCGIGGFGVGLAFGGRERWARVSVGVLQRAS